MLDRVNDIDTKSLADFLVAAGDDITAHDAWSVMKCSEELMRLDGEIITDYLIPKLTTSQLNQLAESARTINDQRARIEAYATYAKYSGDDYVEAAMHAITGWQSGNEPWEQVRVLTVVLPDAPPLMISMAHDWAVQIDNHGALAEYLLPALADHAIRRKESRTA